jgi:hypothetical protein
MPSSFASEGIFLRQTNEDVSIPRRLIDTDVTNAREACKEFGGHARSEPVDILARELNGEAFDGLRSFFGDFEMTSQKSGRRLYELTLIVSKSRRRAGARKAEEEVSEFERGKRESGAHCAAAQRSQ